MDNERISRDELLTQVAVLFAKRAICKRLQVGCVIAMDNRIISTGYNGPLSGGIEECNSTTCDLESSCIHSIHAEANAIANAAKLGISLAGGTVYLTHSPCKDCAKLLVQSGIHKVVYLEVFRSDEGLRILNRHHIILKKHANS